MRPPAAGPDARRQARTSLEADHVTRRFGGLVAVRDVDLVIPEGGIVSIIGPNGAGKTTFFNVIAGIIDPIGGIRDVQGAAADHPAAAGLARVRRSGSCRRPSPC